MKIMLMYFFIRIIESGKEDIVEQEIKKTYEKINMREEAKERIYAQIVQSKDKSPGRGRKVSRIWRLAMAACLVIGIIISSSVYTIHGTSDYRERVSHRNFKLSLSRRTTVLIGPLKKNTPTGTNAEVIIFDAIPPDDIVIAYVSSYKIGGRMPRVSKGDAVSLRGTKKWTKLSIPYQTGKGIEGKEYYLCVTLAQNSANRDLKISCNFEP